VARRSQALRGPRLEPRAPVKAVECAEAWVVRAAVDPAVAAAAEIEEEPVEVEAAAELVVAEVAEVRAAVKRNATASPSQLTFRTFLTTQISTGLSAI